MKETPSNIVVVKASTRSGRFVVCLSVECDATFFMYNTKDCLLEDLNVSINLNTFLIRNCLEAKPNSENGKLQTANSTKEKPCHQIL